MEIFSEKHERNCADQAKLLTSLIQGTQGEMNQKGPQVQPPLTLATLTLGKDYEDPFFRPLADGFIYSSFDLARSAIQHGVEIVRHVRNTVVGLGSCAEADEGKPVALLAVDFTREENGWPCTHEAPVINLVLLPPLSLYRPFESDLEIKSLVSRFGVGPTPLRGIEWQQTDNSEAGIRVAVDHLQNFIRTLPGAVFPKEVTAVFAVDT